MPGLETFLQESEKHSFDSTMGGLIRTGMPVAFGSNLPAYSCQDAADKRGIQLHEELKTLLLRYADGYVAVHLRANLKVDFNAVRYMLHGKKPSMIPAVDLADQFGLEYGLCNPMNVPKGWRHLIDLSLMVGDRVYTNAGARQLSIAFHGTDLYHHLPKGGWAVTLASIGEQENPQPQPIRSFS